MKLADILRALDALSPFLTAEKWDNVGLQLGHPEREITTVVATLECDRGCIEAAPEGALIVAHHPLIFSPLRRLDLSTYPAALLEKMVRKNLSLIAMHTNFDQSHLNRYVGEKVLGLACDESDGHLLYARWEGSFAALVERVKERLGLASTRMVVPARGVERVALTTGSGGSLLSQVKAGCFLTGDLKYHDAVAARELGVGLIEIGHHASERWFAPLLADQLKTMPLDVIIYDTENPFIQG